MPLLGSRPRADGCGGFDAKNIGFNKILAAHDGRRGKRGVHGAFAAEGEGQEAQAGELDGIDALGYGDSFTTIFLGLSRTQAEQREKDPHAPIIGGFGLRQQD